MEFAVPWTEDMLKMRSKLDPAICRAGRGHPGEVTSVRRNSMWIVVAAL